MHKIQRRVHSTLSRPDTIKLIVWRSSGDDGGGHSSPQYNTHVQNVCRRSALCSVRNVLGERERTTSCVASNDTVFYLCFTLGEVTLGLWRQWGSRGGEVLLQMRSKRVAYLNVKRSGRTETSTFFCVRSSTNVHSINATKSLRGVVYLNANGACPTVRSPFRMSSSTEF